MSKNYYYLIGKDQVGPFSAQELVKLNLSPETLVWTEGMASWERISELSDHYAQERPVPPPPPPADFHGVEPGTYSREGASETTGQARDVKFQVTAMVLVGLLLLTVGLGLLDDRFMESKVDQAKQKITAQAAAIFEGKSEIIDGEIYRSDGQLENVSQEIDYSDVSLGITHWEQEQKLFSVFRLQGGGFTVKKLTRLGDDGFEILTLTSGDMGYLIPATRRAIVGNNFNFNTWKSKDTYGTVSNYRTPVQQYYQKAYDYLTKNDKSGAYVAGKLVDIKNFLGFKNDYYGIENIAPTTFSESGTHFISWHSTHDYDNMVYWDEAKVFYSVEGKHYEAVLNQKKFTEDRFELFGQTGGFLVAFLVLLGISRPKFFSSLNLYGKIWISATAGEFLFFTYSFWGTAKFTETKEDNLTRGTVKIIDRGKTMILSYPNKELFYKIENLSAGRLKLRSLKDSSELLFSAAV